MNAQAKLDGSFSEFPLSYIHRLLKAQFGLVDLSPGKYTGNTYKTIEPGIKTWRVTDPNASNPGSPGNSPSDYSAQLLYTPSILVIIQM
jgi:hypothetical protein